MRNAVVIPSAALGGAIYGGLSIPGTGLAYGGSPAVAFAFSSLIGVAGTAYLLAFGREFEPYA